MFNAIRKSIPYALACAGLLTACTDKKAHSKEMASTAGQTTSETAPTTVTIVRQWMLPAYLNEISGIVPYRNLLACIQDEDGIIFLFNPATGQVEKQIPFGEKGDYEGISVIDETAWVLRSDGQLFEVRNFASGNPVLQQYATPLTQKQDTEGLTYDVVNKRLLISVKGKDPESTETKSVFAFNLTTHRMDASPVYQLSVAEPTASGKKGKKKTNKLQPSEIALHPKTGELYVLDGPKSILYIMDTTGAEIRSYPLGTKDFPQPEGLAFTPDGRFYISTEGGTRRGAILEVRL
ncbi:MAG: hypothetical protein EOP52_06735 [Sphingobacteriales bacterium]|nr:MAG: hypothetical protein EOP52_06735 [Sphingobacteriales bacterium]